MFCHACFGSGHSGSTRALVREEVLELEILENSVGEAGGANLWIVDDNGPIAGRGKEAGFENDGGSPGVYGVVVAPPGEGIVAGHVAADVGVEWESGRGSVRGGDSLEEPVGAAGKIPAGTGEFEATGRAIGTAVGVDSHEDVGPIARGNSGGEKVDLDSPLDK